MMVNYAAKNSKIIIITRIEAIITPMASAIFLVFTFVSHKTHIHVHALKHKSVNSGQKTMSDTCQLFVNCFLDHSYTLHSCMFWSYCTLQWETRVGAQWTIWVTKPEIIADLLPEKSSKPYFNAAA